MEKTPVAKLITLEMYQEASALSGFLAVSEMFINAKGTVIVWLPATPPQLLPTHSPKFLII